MIVRLPTLRPVKQAVALFDRQVVDARDPLLHQAIRGKFPIFVAIAAEPPAIGVMPFIGETNGDAISVVRPEFLDEAVFQLALPLARQKGLDFATASKEFGAVPPDAPGRIGERDARRIAAVPAILGGAHLLCRAYSGKGGERRASFHFSSSPRCPGVPSSLAALLLQ